MYGAHHTSSPIIHSEPLGRPCRCREKVLILTRLFENPKIALRKVATKFSPKCLFNDRGPTGGFPRRNEGVELIHYVVREPYGNLDRHVISIPKWYA